MAVGLDPGILAGLGLPPASAGLPQLRPALAEVGHGVGSLLTPTAAGAAAVVGGHDAVLLSDGLGKGRAGPAGVLDLRHRSAGDGAQQPLLLVDEGRGGRAGGQGRGGGRRGGTELGHGGGQRWAGRWAVDGHDEGTELLVDGMITGVAACGADGGHAAGYRSRHGGRTASAATTATGGGGGIAARRVVGGHVGGLLVDVVDDAVERYPVDGGGRQVEGQDGMEGEGDGLAQDGDLGRRTGLGRGPARSLSSCPWRSDARARRLLPLPLLPLRGFGGRCAAVGMVLDAQPLDVELIHAGGGAAIPPGVVGAAGVGTAGVAAALFGGRRSAEHAPALPLLHLLVAVLKGVGQVAADGGAGDDDRVAVTGGADVGGVDVPEADAGAAVPVVLGGRCCCRRPPAAVRHLDLPAGQLGEVGLGRRYRRKLVKVVRVRRWNRGALGRHGELLLVDRF